MGNESSSVELEAAAAALADLSDEDAVDYGNTTGLGAEDQALDDAAAEFCGFRVLGIQEESPASRVGFVSFFDFIMAANGIRLDTRDSTFMELIAQSEEKPMQLDVFNIKSQTTRSLTLTPSRQWAGKGLLGVTIRFDSYEYAEDQLLHVLDVTPQSPAFQAGLTAGSDYLLGTPERVFRDTDDLQDEILDALDAAFQCYVYSSTEDQVRIVRISPNDRWGGAGVLGAEVGHGVLHRLPEACRTTVGTSIGFVSLSKEATAATDPYLRKLRVDEEKIDGVQEESVQQEDLQQELVEAVEAAQEPAAPLPEAQPHASPVGNAVDSASNTEPTQPPPQASPKPHVVIAPAAPFIAAYSSDPSPSSKPRYAARIDPRFPISTVAVLADPTQLS